jgi:hypothetical protein
MEGGGELLTLKCRCKEKILFEEMFVSERQQQQQQHLTFTNRASYI